MSDNGTEQNNDSLRERITGRGEEAIGKLANELLGNPLVSNTIQGVMEATEKVSQAQDVAMGAFNLPKAADVDKLQRRLRSLSQRLEGVEDGIDKIDQRLAELDKKLGELAGGAK